jgi:hypothetical protein
MRIIIFSLLSLFTFTTHASTVSVEGVNITYSCGYFSNDSEKLHITYSNAELPANTVIRLHWGLGGYTPYQDRDGTLHQNPITWLNPVGYTPGQDVIMTQISSTPPTYTVTFTVATHDRDSNDFYTQFKFLFQQQQPEGTYYDRPGLYGYYEADFSNGGACYRTNQDYPMRPLQVFSKIN